MSTCYINGKLLNSIVNSNNSLLKNDIEIKVEACHYAFLKFAALTDVSGTELENMIGIKKLDDNIKQDVYDLPMLRCEVLNCSRQERVIQEPMIQGRIEIKGEIVDAMGFMFKSQADKRLVCGAKTDFTIYGMGIINIIKAFLENKIESIYRIKKF